MPQTFFITSYGRTATYWLTSLLNTHPEIYCTHGPTLERLFTDASDPPPEHAAEVVRDQEQFYRLPLGDVIVKMEEKYKANAYGNVHAFTAVRLPGEAERQTLSLSRTKRKPAAPPVHARAFL